MEKVRSFIAIGLPIEVKTYLADLEQKLKKGGHSSVKWVSPEGIHLTIKFLGQVEPEKLKTVTVAIKEASQGIPPLHLELGGLGAFPGFNRPRVAWVGLEGELDRLITIQKRLDSLLIPIGFPREDRPFSPHLTLSRVKETISNAERQSFGQLLQRTQFEADCAFMADSVNLMRSQLTPAGAIYSLLDAVPLVGL